MLFRRRKPELMNAEKEAEYIRSLGLNLSAHKKETLRLSDGCPIRITASGLSRAIGKDGKDRALPWRGRVGASNEIK